MTLGAPLFSEGSRASRIARVLLYLGSMAALLIGTFDVGHALHLTAGIVGLVCLLGCFLEHWRVHRTGDTKIESLNLGERARGRSQ